jgi:FkbM family methyltransferase
MINTIIKSLLLKRTKEQSWVVTKKHGFIWKLNLTKYLDEKIARGELWEEESIRLIYKLVKPGMHVLDVGANFGYFTLFLSRIVSQHGLVIAFEPTTEYSTRLEWHISKNKCENVKIERFGLSNISKRQRIYIGECSATLTWDNDSIPRFHETINLISLDEWWSNYTSEGNIDKLDFIKVDIDGHEQKFLDGAEMTIKKHMPLILIEFSQEASYSNGYFVWDLVDHLENLGYVLCNVQDGRPYINRKALLIDAGNFAYSANVLAISNNSIYEK